MGKAFRTTALAAALTATMPQAFAADEADTLVYEASFFADARPNTAFDMIGRLPGFVFNSGIAQDGTQARGYASSGGNVLIDGRRPTAKADTLDQILTRIPANDVERIEIVRGGAPGIDMQGHAVVANVIRKKAESKEIIGTAGAFIFATGEVKPDSSVAFTRNSGQTAYELSLTASGYNDLSGAKGHHDVLRPDGSLLSHASSRYENSVYPLSLKGSVTTPLFNGLVSANTTLKTTSGVYRQTDASPLHVEAFKTPSHSWSGELGVNWKGPVGNTEVETLILQNYGTSLSTNTDDDFPTLKRFNSHATNGESIARASARYSLSDSLSFESGGEGAYNFRNGHTRYTINGVVAMLPSPDAKVEERRGEIFTRATWKPSKPWTLEIGARLERSTIDFHGDNHLTRSFFYPKPRALLTWSLSKESQLRLRYEQVVGQLNFGNFIAVSDLATTGITAGNGGLKPDQRSQYEITYERHFWGNGAAVIGVMHEQIRDVVDYVPIRSGLSVFDAPGNIGNGTNERITASLTLPLEKLGLKGGLLTGKTTLNLGDVRDPVTGEGRVISGQHPTDINIALSQDLDRLKSTWTITYVTCGGNRTFYRVSEIARQGCVASTPYLIFGWDYKPTPRWTVHFGVQDAAGVVWNQRREIYSGSRNGGTLSSINDFRIKAPPIFNLRVRRSFN